MCDEMPSVPAWPVGDRHVGFTCPACKHPVEVLVEGGKPGVAVDVKCDHREGGQRECGAVTRVRIRRAMFS